MCMRVKILLLCVLLAFTACAQTLHITPLQKTQAQRIEQLEKRVVSLEAQMYGIQTYNMPWIAWYIGYFKACFDQVWGKTSPDFQFRDRSKDRF